MILACEGRFYNVHRLVLGVCSDYFDAILERTPCKHPVIVLRDIKAEDLESLLNYMYIGEVSVSQSDLGRLFKTAEQLCIKGLAVVDEPPTGFTDPANLSSNVARDKQPGLIYATSNGSVMTFVAHTPQTHHEVQQTTTQQQMPTVQSFRTASRSSPMSKRRRKDDSSNTTSSSSAANVTAASVMNATTVTANETTGSTLVYQTTSGAPTSNSIGVNVAGVSVAVGSGSPRTPPDYEGSAHKDHHAITQFKEESGHTLLQVSKAASHLTFLVAFPQKKCNMLTMQHINIYHALCYTGAMPSQHFMLLNC